MRDFIIYYVSIKKKLDDNAKYYSGYETKIQAFESSTSIEHNSVYTSEYVLSYYFIDIEV